MLKQTTTIQTLLSLVILGSDIANGQVIPDQTLSNPSLVEVNGNTITITGGTALKKNLFHSFETFSLTGQEAYFNNSLNIENIFSRVTGTLPSNIDGLIQANGTANLFFLNPNGIIFGPNAAPNIGGAFIATTANQIKFADRTSFGATSNHQS